MWCHLLLAMPVIGLGLFLLLPLPIALPAYLVAAGLSLFVYFKVFQAMRQPIRSGREAMIGTEAVVVTDLAPQGQIRCRGEVWSAISRQKLVKGQKVRIVGFEGVKAVVEGRDWPGCPGEG